MIQINTDCYETVKAGSIKNVVFFSDSTDPRPAAPYVVIKPEQGDGRVNFRIFAHYKPGEQDKLDHYIRYELSDLMKVKKSLSGKPQFKSDGYWTDTIVTNDDGTISASRVFYVPVIIT